MTHNLMVWKHIVSEYQAQWTKLRDKFAREKRQKEIETRSGSEASRRNTFVLYENMLFLEKHVKRRRYVCVPMLWSIILIYLVLFYLTLDGVSFQIVY